MGTFKDQQLWDRRESEFSLPEGVVWRRFLVMWVLSSEERPRLEIENWKSSVYSW